MLKRTAAREGNLGDVLPMFMGFVEWCIKCPICKSVPRDGVMIQCIIGHNVCIPCKDKLGHDARCPQSTCTFNTPPTKNFTVTSIIAEFSFERSCKFKSAYGCNFTGSESTLQKHEFACRQPRRSNRLKQSSVRNTPYGVSSRTSSKCIRIPINNVQCR